VCASCILFELAWELIKLQEQIGLKSLEELSFGGKWSQKGNIKPLHANGRVAKNGTAYCKI
jgi:hypothetical protein